MKAGADRRKPRLIDRRFQLGLAWRLVLVYVVLFYLGIVLLFAPSMYGLASNGSDLAAREAASAEFLLLHRRVWPALLISFVGIVAYTLVFSHRIAGPLYRVNAVLEALIAGKDPGPVAFRRNDYFQRTAELLSVLAGKPPGAAKAAGGAPAGPPEGTGR